MTKGEGTGSVALPKLKLLDSKRSWTHRNEVLSSFTQSYFAEHPGTINILEAGCGRKWRVDLGDVEYKLTGIDISKKALELRQAEEGDLDESVVGDLRTATLNPEGFDMVYSADVIEHIDGAEPVVTNFFKWLKPQGLLILIFPDRDSVVGFLTRILPFWVHVLFYRYVQGYADAGKPGCGPFPTYHDPIVSRRAIHEYCTKHDHSIVVEYGRPYNMQTLGRVGSKMGFVFKLVRYLSFGKLQADHLDMVYIIQKNSVKRGKCVNRGLQRQPQS